MRDDDDTRTGHLAGEADGSLSAAVRAGLDEVRALLASPAVWVQPPASLEVVVVATVAQAARARAPASGALDRSGRRRLAWPVPAVAVTGMLAATLAAIVVVLGAPGKRAGAERLAMVVSGTALAPRAHGTATLTRTPSGWEIHLSVTGLPHFAGGRYYQGWLQDTTGDRVAIGTFNDARDVTLWAGVSPVTFTVLTVTVKRCATSGAEPGVRVLFGAVGTRAHHRP